MQHLKKTSEQQLQKKIITQLEKQGYLVLKLIKCNKNGYPDLLATKENDTIFIEVKRPDGKLSELQKVRINEMRLKGIKVKVWTDYNIDFIWTQ
jgi:Holliday junction resolvase